jgi:putative membrane protein
MASVVPLRLPKEVLMNARDVIVGGLAGLIATAPMSAVMLGIHRLLPPHERYALPPEQITHELLTSARNSFFSDDQERKRLTIPLHFAFGAAAGAVYGVLSALMPLRRRPSLTGVVFGWLVWLSAYLGFLPAMDILPPATEHPARRNILMIVAHTVWGGCTGWIVRRLSP